VMVDRVKVGGRAFTPHPHQAGMIFSALPRIFLHLEKSTFMLSSLLHNMQCRTNQISFFSLDFIWLYSSSLHRDFTSCFFLNIRNILAEISAQFLLLESFLFIILPLWQSVWLILYISWLKCPPTGLHSMQKQPRNFRWWFVSNPPSLLST
jgi:hypothetical protein